MEAAAIAIFCHGFVEHNFVDCYLIHRNPVDRNLGENVLDGSAAACAIQIPVLHGAMRL
jgi:hypothetical protein